MPSQRHNAGRDDDALLDAARAGILAVGWKRTTLTDVARRAEVSRMTLYRRWPDMRRLLADLMTREWAAVVAAHAGGDGASPDGTGRARVAGAVAGTVAGLRENALFRAIVDVDPELLLPYLLERRGRTQDEVLALLEAAIADGQRDGSVRPGDPVLLARATLLAAHGFALSAPTMVQPGGPGAADLDAELRRLVDGYLTP